MSFWPELVDAAVLGTGRSAPSAPTPAIASLDAGAGDDRWREGTGLLHWAAVASRSRRAGQEPASAAGQPAPEPAPDDARPPVSHAARLRLTSLLDESKSELVAEWLRLLARTGCRPPDSLLPALLDGATGDQELRRALRPALGPLAAWLAAANPRWDWAVTNPAQADPESERGSWMATWTTSSHRARRELLGLVRGLDPAAGRDLITATWSGDPARDRAAFTGCLAVGLSPLDEPLLDRALADRAGEVRREAAVLLARLPGSAFAERAASRAAAAVQVKGLRRRLEIAPPTQASEEMVADGIDPSPPRGIGRQTWLLQQIVAGPPASWWAGHLGLEPTSLLSLATSTDWTAPLETGWADAASRDAHQAWIGAFLDLPAARLERMGDGTAITLFRALTDADRDAWLAAHGESPLFSAAELVPGPWSAALSATARARIAELATADPGRSPQARRLFRVAALRLEPPAMIELDPALVHPTLAHSWAELMSTLSIRAVMRRELTEEPAS